MSNIQCGVDKILSQVSSPQKLMWEQADAPHRRLIEQALFYLKHHIAGEALQEGPTPTATARWILGASLRDLGEGLTRREASLWLRQSEHSTPQKWLWGFLVEEHSELREVARPLSLPVLRWVQECMGDPKRKATALRDRRGMLGEAHVGGRVIDRMDEILVCDLHRSPVRTLEAAQQRLVDQEWGGDSQLIPKMKWHTQLPAGVTILANYGNLRREGVEMNHCAASYAQEIADRRCLMFALKEGGERSTAELRDGTFRQHVGFGNSSPPASCVELLKLVVKERPWLYDE